VAVGLSGQGDGTALVVSCLISHPNLGAADIAQALDGLTSWVRAWQSSQ
jgi:hypothetical protein